MLADPDRGRAIARRGQAEVLRSHGNRAVGLRILERLERIAATGLARRAQALAAKAESTPAPAMAPARKKR